MRGHERLGLAAVAGRRDLDLVRRVLGEHAEVEQGARAAVEVDDDVGVVEDVRPLAAVALVEVVHVLRARGVDARRALRARSGS